MTDYKIETSMRVPPKKTGVKGAREGKWPLASLKKAQKKNGELVGDCMVVKKANKVRIVAAISRLRKTSKHRFTTRVIGDNFHVWKI